MKTFDFGGLSSFFSPLGYKFRPKNIKRGIITSNIDDLKLAKHCAELINNNNVPGIIVLPDNVIKLMYDRLSPDVLAANKIQHHFRKNPLSAGRPMDLYDELSVQYAHIQASTMLGHCNIDEKLGRITRARQSNTQLMLIVQAVCSALESKFCGNWQAYRDSNLSKNWLYIDSIVSLLNDPCVGPDEKLSLMNACTLNECIDTIISDHLIAIKYYEQLRELMPSYEALLKHHRDQVGGNYSFESSLYSVDPHSWQIISVNINRAPLFANTHIPIVLDNWLKALNKPVYDLINGETFPQVSIGMLTYVDEYASKEVLNLFKGLIAEATQGAIMTLNIPDHLVDMYSDVLTPDEKTSMCFI